jgi:hypothetical protein
MAISSATGLSDAQHGVQLRRAVVASTVGTIIEAYDFLLYVQVAPLVFAKLYFLHCKRLALSTPCRSSRRTRSLDLCNVLLGDVHTQKIPSPPRLDADLALLLTGGTCGPGRRQRCSWQSEAALAYSK